MLSMRKSVGLGLTLSLCAGFFSAVAAPAAPKLGVLQHWKLGGAGGWDYLALDAKGRLFVSRATRVDVVSVESGKIIVNIPETQGVHGIAFADSLNRGFTSNGPANTVTAFDLDTLKVIQEAKVSDRNPDAILYEPAATPDSRL